MTEAPLANYGSTISDRRRVRRERTLMGAQIIFRGGLFSMAGHILNVSDAGALLRPSDIALCPHKFTLKPRFDSPRDCEVVWRSGEMVGVRYV